MENHLYNNQSFKSRRKELRKNQTEAEKALWSKIKNKQIEAFKFFRQYSVGPYIIDGGYHLKEENKIYDEERERFLSGNFITTIRFKNEEVLNTLDKTTDSIKENLTILLRKKETICKN